MKPKETEKPCKFCQFADKLKGYICSCGALVRYEITKKGNAMTNENEKPIHTESMQYRFDALNTAIHNHIKLTGANEWFGANSNRMPPGVFNTISGLLWQALTSSQKRIISCAEFYCVAAKKTQEELDAEEPE